MYDDVAMRTIVDIPKSALETLTELSRQDNISRAEAIRRAINLYIKSKHGEEKGEAFGLWRSRAIDGRQYEDRLRDEWERIPYQRLIRKVVDLYAQHHQS